jgi:hypothetical protein
VSNNSYFKHCFRTYIFQIFFVFKVFLLLGDEM